MSGLSSFLCEMIDASNVDTSLFCPICKELMNKPVSLSCGHSACKDCMLKLVRSQGCSKSCSLCRATINQTQFNISVPLQAIIAKIKVQCTVPGCPWSGEHQEKESHQAQCEYSERKCERGCVGSFHLAQLNDHNSICPYKRVKCRFCGGMYHRFNLPTHEESCVEVPQPCPLNCGECIPRSHVPVHLLTCEEKALKCEVKGCNNYVRKRHQFLHDRQYEQSHQVLLKSEIETLRCSMFDQVTVNTRRVIKQIQVFKWEVGEVKTGELKAVACPMFGFDRNQFVCRWDQIGRKIYLHKVTGLRPITVKARFAFLSGGKINVFPTPSPVTLCEGQIVETSVDTVRGQDVIIHIIIIEFKHE